MSTRRMIIFRDEGWRIGEPRDIAGVVFYDSRNGDIEAHLEAEGRTPYAFAYLVTDGFGEWLVARRCEQEPLDASVVISRVMNGEDAIRAGLEEDQRKWKHYDAELERVAMAQELQRTVKP